MSISLKSWDNKVIHETKETMHMTSKARRTGESISHHISNLLSNPPDNTDDVNSYRSFYEANRLDLDTVSSIASAFVTTEAATNNIMLLLPDNAALWSLAGVFGFRHMLKPDETVTLYGVPIHVTQGLDNPVVIDIPEAQVIDPNEH